MPELPEAETIARVLDHHLRGKTLAGHGTLQRVWRTGKCVVFDFGEEQLTARLGMTGTFRLNTQPGIHTRQVFDFEGTSLLYNDIRKFGRLIWGTGPVQIGPDVLAIHPSEFAERLQARKRPIKALLLDQNFVSGIGNIYADECLFTAKVHPLQPAHQVDGRKLHSVVVSTLEESIRCGGSTILDFFDPLGRSGRYQEKHKVYGRAGQLCPECSTPILRNVFAARGTHYCPECQQLLPQPSPQQKPVQHRQDPTPAGLPSRRSRE